MGLLINAHSTNANLNIINSAGGDWTRKKLPEPVYYVESPNDDTVLVGMDVIISRRKIREENVFVVEWYDTSHERMMTASDIRWEDGDFMFERTNREGGGVYYFTPMNLEIYNKKVKQHLLAGADFNNEGDLVRSFLDTVRNDV